MAFFEDTSISHDITTDAGFRAWSQKIHDGLAAVGLVQTSDTGQINLTTVTTPAVNSTDAGYEIWRFSDAAQSTDPIFFKVSYGRGGAAARPRMSVQVGTGSNGSGTLTNPNTAQPLGPNSTPAATGYIAICFRDGALSLAWSPDPSQTSPAAWQFWAIERLRDPVDFSLQAGAFVFIANAGGYNDIRRAGAWVPNNHSWSGGGSVAISGKVVFGRLSLQAHPCAALRCLLFSYSAAVSPGDSGNVTVGGVSRAYKRPNTSFTTAPFSNGTNTTATANPILPSD